MRTAFERPFTTDVANALKVLHSESKKFEKQHGWTIKKMESEELLRNSIKVNVEGITKVTQAILPRMVKRKKCAIVNIGSSAAIVISSDPLYVIYAATKAYINKFLRYLYVECKNSGIDVPCQVPLYMATKMASIKKSSFFTPSIDGYAKAAMRWIGSKPRCMPY
ncbi:hypothetical protein REPUB_Repub03eG0156800 [Reevesia pubescens]